MFFELFFFILLGIGTGVITGLVPGLHPNTIFVLVLSFVPLISYLPTPYTIVFVISLAISNTFTDFLPSIFFGAPDPSTSLSVLPGHRMLLAGRGYEALFLTVIGGTGVTILTLASLPLLFYLIPVIYGSIHSVIHVILSLIVMWMIISRKGIVVLYSLFVFLLTGIFGFITLNSLPSETALFPALTGMFAFSNLIISIREKSRIPPQDEVREVKGSHLRGILTGWFAGWLSGLLPGIGASQAGVIASHAFGSKTRSFITALGGINTSNILFTFVVFYTLGKTRSGAAWAISQVVDRLVISDMVLISVAGAITCFISVIITLRAGRFIIRRMKNLDYAMFGRAIMIVLMILVFAFSGPLGVMVSLVGASLGIFTIMIGVRRSMMMGFLIFPTILYFSGTSSYLGIMFGL